jgi:hypothetical protein
MSEDEKPKSPPGPKIPAKPVTTARPVLKNSSGNRVNAGEVEAPTVLMKTLPPRNSLPAARSAVAPIPVAKKPIPPRTFSPSTSYPSGLTPVQRKHLDSSFGDNFRERTLNTRLGTNTDALKLSDLEAAMPAEVTYSGDVPAIQVSAKDKWKAVNAPVKSQPGKRSKAVLEQVLKQFAVATNPRYVSESNPNEGGTDFKALLRSKGHIFAWDVSCAMACEIPHYVGARELTLVQTVDWMRHEAPMRGWSRASEFDVYDLAMAGRLVIAIPREAKVYAIGVVVPQEPSLDGKPLLAAACASPGYGLHPTTALGVRVVDYFHHP